MNATISIDALQIRKELERLWSENLRMESTQEGIIMSLPLMYADCWHVELRLEQKTPTQAILHDGGETLGKLVDAGMNIQKATLRQAISEMGKTYGFTINGLTLERVLPLPVEPVVIQMFAEGLVAVSYLAPRQQATMESNLRRVMDRSVSGFFEAKQIKPLRGHALRGSIEQEIRVDYYVETPRPLAVQPVARVKDIHAYMERWAFRWLDLKEQNPSIRRAMVFDPDQQQWTQRSLAIGRNPRVCDLFIPYFEAGALEELLTA